MYGAGEKRVKKACTSSGGRIFTPEKVAEFEGTLQGLKKNGDERDKSSR